jgi:putative transposase
MNADLNAAINILRLHTPESQGAVGRGLPTVRDRGNGLETQPVVYRWTSGAGWVLKAPTSNEAMRMKAVNHKPMNRLEGTPTLQGGEEVSVQIMLLSIRG